MPFPWSTLMVSSMVTSEPIYQGSISIDNGKSQTETYIPKSSALKKYSTQCKIFVSSWIFMVTPKNTTHSSLHALVILCPVSDSIPISSANKILTSASKTAPSTSLLINKEQPEYKPSDKSINHKFSPSKLPSLPARTRKETEKDGA